MPSKSNRHQADDAWSGHVARRPLALPNTRAFGRREFGKATQFWRLRTTRRQTIEWHANAVGNVSSCEFNKRTPVHMSYTFDPPDGVTGSDRIKDQCPDHHMWPAILERPSDPKQMFVG